MSTPGRPSRAHGDSDGGEPAPRKPRRLILVVFVIAVLVIAAVWLILYIVAS